MKIGLSFLVFCIIIASVAWGFGKIQRGSPAGEVGGDNLYKFNDKEEGVVCYRSDRNLSCVKVGGKP
ncbi:hypothetical protein ORF066 [Pseudomonas phage PA11]|uniref:hypothetical protein ORF066 n=1 Tax=Pseudomonas phage PA11 TaxID=347327 RepID=UPI00015543BC|nr:hypothetical protein ORF066 [Pseudomonas phage PA11]